MLPIAPFLPAIVSALREKGSVLVKAQPGAGKTTQVPAALLPALPGRILVLEPRRLAAQLSAERVAEELGEACGQTVGYQVRFNSRQSAATRLLFVTEGVFLRLLQESPSLTGVSAVVIDEFHERHLHTDLALAMVNALRQSSRPDLQLLVMSATLDSASLERYLPNVSVFDVPGRTFPVAVEYIVDAEAALLEDRVSRAAARMLEDTRSPGDILVFLTGIQDIRRCAETLRSDIPSGKAVILPLTADLPPSEQALVFRPNSCRKIILATNVAETSLTIPGVTGVIDSGLAKVAGHAAWSGISTLDVKKISQAASIQRSGRAGRTAAGVAYRLFSEADFLSRAPFSVPDIQRLDLAEIFLTVQDLQQRSGRPVRIFDQALPWFESPAIPAVVATRQLLIQLGAVSGDDSPTVLGERLAQLPFHPRLGAIVVKGQDLGCAEAALAAACLISEGMVIKRSAGAFMHSDCDVRVQLELIARINLGQDISPQSLAAAIDRGRVKQVLAVYAQLSKRLKLGPWPRPGVEDESRLTICLLAGFPDRVAKRRSVPAAGSRHAATLYNFCLGRGGYLAETSVVRNAELILAIDASEVQSRSADRGTAIYLASALNPEILRQQQSTLMKTEIATVWNEDAARVDLMQRVSYGELTISDNRLPVQQEAADKLENMLHSKLIEAWPKPFPDDEDLRSYHARIDWIGNVHKEVHFPIFEGEMLELLQADICSGKRSFREINERRLVEYIEDQLPYEQQELLRREAAIELRIANGRRLKVTYEPGRPPFVTGFVQDFFGLDATPLLAGRGGLTLHLLGPNRRPLQVTADLGGFWQRHYPDIRSELARKYPRHYWPEEPATAEPFLYYNQMRAGHRPDIKP